MSDEAPIHSPNAAASSIALALHNGSNLRLSSLLWVWATTVVGEGNRIANRNNKKIIRRMFTSVRYESSFGLAWRWAHRVICSLWVAGLKHLWERRAILKATVSEICRTIWRNYRYSRSCCLPFLSSGINLGGWNQSPVANQNRYPGLSSQL